MELQLLTNRDIVNPVIYRNPKSVPSLLEKEEIAQLAGMVALCSFSTELRDAELSLGETKAKLALQIDQASDSLLKFWAWKKGSELDHSDRAYLAYLGFQIYETKRNRFSRNELWGVLEGSYNYSALDQEFDGDLIKVDRVSNGLLFILLDAFGRRFKQDNQVYRI